MAKKIYGIVVNAQTTLDSLNTKQEYFKGLRPDGIVFLSLQPFNIETAPMWSEVRRAFASLVGDDAVSVQSVNPAGIDQIAAAGTITIEGF